ncbi:hypothetical protein E4U14_007475 [Claviceps sp. LM454 group G7]|nr:hypothetical protein E4U14_007475 [Claviceps sp. LM454 group G7]
MTRQGCILSILFPSSALAKTSSPTQLPLTGVRVHGALDKAVTDILGQGLHSGTCIPPLRSLGSRAWREGIVFDGSFDLQDITTTPSTERLAGLERRKTDGDGMNPSMHTVN